MECASTKPVAGSEPESLWVSAVAIMYDGTQVIITAAPSRARVSSVADGADTAFILAEALVRATAEPPLVICALYTRGRVIPRDFIEFTGKTGLAATAHPAVATLSLLAPELFLELLSSPVSAASVA